MDESRFDTLARGIAAPSRRGLLGALGLAVLGNLIRRSTDAGAKERRNAGKHAFAAQSNAACAARCKDLFPPGKKRGRCISDGAHGRGPCVKPVCTRQCANDADCCDEPGFGCCDDACTRLGHDGECPPPVCVPPSLCTADDQCCGTDLCSCGDPNVCVQFRSLGTGACCKSDDECIQQCVKSDGEPFGVCCDPTVPETCICRNCPA